MHNPTAISRRRSVLVLSGSTRAGSLNTRLAQHVAQALAEDDDVVVRSDLAALPFFDADVESAGVPPVVTALADQVRAADLLVVVTPEYNGTTPGVLANAVDWLSRPHRQSPLTGRDVAVLSASPGPGAGARAAEHLRTVLAGIGADVRPEGVSVPFAATALAGEPTPELLDDLRAALLPPMALRRTA